MIFDSLSSTLYWLPVTHHVFSYFQSHGVSKIAGFQGLCLFFIDLLILIVFGSFVIFRTCMYETIFFALYEVSLICVLFIVHAIFRCFPNRHDTLSVGAYELFATATHCDECARQGLCCVLLCWLVVYFILVVLLSLCCVHVECFF